MKNPTDLVEQIETLFDKRTRQGATIDPDKVINWSKNDNLEVKGIVYSILTDKDRYSRLSHPIDSKFSFQFCLDFLLLCMTNSHDGDWVLTRYTAAYELLRLYSHISNESDGRKIKVIKKRLEDIYISGAEKDRRVIVNGFLEHLFENVEYRKHFIDWNDHPILQTPYREAMAWGSS